MPGQASEFPKSIHSSIQPEAIGAVLAKHYNVGVTNPWFEAGLSDQPTYTRRRLPWSGYSYTADPDTGRVSGPNADQIPAGLKQVWLNMAAASKNTGVGEVYADLEELKEERLDEIGSKLEGGGSAKVELTTVSGGTVMRSASSLTEDQRASQNVSNDQLKVRATAGASHPGGQNAAVVAGEGTEAGE